MTKALQAFKDTRRPNIACAKPLKPWYQQALYCFTKAVQAFKDYCRPNIESPKKLKTSTIIAGLIMHDQSISSL